MNKFKIRGRIYKDWKVFFVEDKMDGNKKVPMAVNTVYGRYSPKAGLFMDITLFGDDAEAIVEKTAKDDEVELTGMLRQRKFKGKDGNSRTMTSMLVKTWRRIEAEKKYDPDEDAPFE